MLPDFTKLDRAFNPKCVVVVGDKGKLIWIRAQKDFKGKLYSVQISPASIKAIEALGVANYTSLLDIPDPVDLAIITVPREVAPRILEDCIRKEVAAAEFFTSGFSETETNEGRELERRLAERAKQANFHLIGPNCMGIYNPELGVKQHVEQYVGPVGNVGFIAQSGTHAIRFSLEARLHGVDVNKSISFGNGVVLDATEYLEYFGNEAGIKAIGMYLEGVRDGRKFFRVLKEVSARKPVVIWKGGRSAEGYRSIASHTGSLAISQAIWDAAVKQCGAIQVQNMEELIDTLAALLYLPPVRGNRVGITGGSGGQSVALSDAFAEAGLTVPELTQKSYDEFATFFKLVGGSYRNPIDTGMFNRESTRRIIEILDRDANIDNLVFLQWYIGRSPRPEDLELISLIIEVKKRLTKPIAVIFPTFSTPENMQQAIQAGEKLRATGIPSFYTIEGVARALRNALDYYNFKMG